MELDVKDKKILGQLELDAMQGYSAIAKKVGLSKEVVRYRIEKLVKSGLIDQFVFMINTKLFGYTSYKLYLQLENVDEKKQNEILEHLKNHAFCVWAVTCAGRFDMIVAFFAKTPEHFTKIVNEFLANYSPYIRDTTSNLMVNISHFKRKYIAGSSDVHTPIIGGEAKIDLDLEEIKILTSLSTNARKSYAEIANETGLSLDVIRYRIKKMKDNGVIQGSRLGLNKELFGFEYHKLLLKLKDLTPARERSLVEFFSQNTNIVDVVKTLGEWDMEVDIDVKNSFDLHKIIMDLKNSFPTLIRRYESVQIFKEHKYNFFPMGNYLLGSKSKAI